MPALIQSDDGSSDSEFEDSRETLGSNLPEDVPNLIAFSSDSETEETKSPKRETANYQADTTTSGLKENCVSSLKTSQINITLARKATDYSDSCDTLSSVIRIVTDESIVHDCRITSENLKNDNGIYVIGNINKQTIPMLVDTGATCSIMSTKVFDSVPAEQRPILENRNCGIRSVSGDKIRCRGVTTFKIQFGDTTMPVEFHVADVQDHVLLGMSFLTEFKAKLNLDKGSLEIPGRSIPCLILNGSPKPKSVLLYGEYIIPAGQEMILPGQAKTRKKEAKCNSTVAMVFEPKNNFLKNFGLLACSTTCMHNSTVVPIRVFNPGDDPVIIKTSSDGLRCGFLTPTTVESV